MGQKIERGTRKKPASVTSGAGNSSAALDIAEVFRDKNILLIGCTGFVGKVALSMLLSHYPGLGRLFVLVRPGMGGTPEERFFAKVVTSAAFDPLRERHETDFDQFVRRKVVPIAGDIGRANCAISESDLQAMADAGGIAAVVNSAGLVSFTPSLESAIRINASGAQNAMSLAEKLGAALVHVSTCYVAGRRDGAVWEDEEVVGYFPRREELVDDDFDAEAEIADCMRVIQQTRETANDRRHVSEFRERAVRSLREQRRNPDDESALQLTVARERKLWVQERLTKIGMERAEHWGWTNTYTYTKSLGEQILLKDKNVPKVIVRPAIVESALRFPFPGWNEGFNTTAPLVYLSLKGHRQLVTGNNTALDVIPVDMVCAGILMATAAVISGLHKSVYQLGSSGVNPVSSTRLVELTGLAVRRYRRQLADAGEERWSNRLRARLETHPVSLRRFHRTSAPQIRQITRTALRAIDNNLPSWGAPRLQAIAERVKEELNKIEVFTGRVVDLVELFQPFTHDHDVRFRSDNTKALWHQLSVEDQQKLWWDPESIDWRDYWFNTHFPGLVKWVFPVLDDEYGVKPRSVYTYRDMVELFESAVVLNRHRVAFRYLETADPDGAPVVHTYGRFHELVLLATANLQRNGIVPDDRVALMSENRPDWPIGYFAILRCAATVAPFDSQLSWTEVVNLLRVSNAKVAIFSDRVCERLVEDGIPKDKSSSSRSARERVQKALSRAGLSVKLMGFADLTQLGVEPDLSVKITGDRVASLIFTSGTTGHPKGVMLTHKNLTSMAAKLTATFRLYRHDGLLSLLPLHHTFEFSAGLLMPLIHGASITYLDELSADSLEKAFKSGHITGMVGVPALWQMLHRKIHKRIVDNGIVAQRLFEFVIEGNRKLREKSPYGLDLGKLVFYPIHRGLGGRLRIMISGGSALSPDVMKSFQGLGFKLFEGYGMTEASPVITAQRPGEKGIAGSVGKPLPGVDVRIYDPDENGVGEVICKGSNVMQGYFEDRDTTDSVLRDGWLHTGDLGRLDEENNLFIVGRKKEMILGASGENVYPDELEELYRDSPWVKELSVVGIPSDTGAETVACLVCCDFDRDSLSRDEVMDRVRNHIKEISQKLPFYKRIKVLHFTDEELPKTATRKVQRRKVVAELMRLEKRGTLEETPREPSAETESDWVQELIAKVVQKPVHQVGSSVRLEDLGIDSLMLTELAAAFEHAGVAMETSQLAELHTVSDVVAAASERRRTAPLGQSHRANGRVGAMSLGLDEDIPVPRLFAGLGRRTLGAGQKMLYSRYLDTRVTGSAYVPPYGGFIVAANHSSHLDMGLVKHALGDLGSRLVALAAKDYFFDDPIRRAYFENFTNLVPMERHGSLRESLRLAGEVIRDGYVLLIFPEGTRSDSGTMTDFKPSLGYLALVNRCGILPMYLAGTHNAMKKGDLLPRRKSVQAHVGPFQSYETLRALADGATKAEGYRKIAVAMEGLVRAQCPAEHEWALGPGGRQPQASARGVVS